MIKPSSPSDTSNHKQQFKNSLWQTFAILKNSLKKNQNFFIISFVNDTKLVIFMLVKIN